jgi:hypothetical protein
MPANRVAHAADALTTKSRIVRRDERIVLGGRQHVEPVPSPRDMARSLEASHPK